MHLGLEGIHLILCQVCATPGSKQLELGPLLQKVRQGGSQHRSDTLADPVNSDGVNTALKQLRCRGQQHLQGRWLVSPFQHQIPDLGGSVS
jgi:hypothetical protein